MHHAQWCSDGNEHVKHILHFITNAVDPTLQCTIQNHSEQTNLRITIVTTQPLGTMVIPRHVPVYWLAGATEQSTTRVPGIDLSQSISYDCLMDLIFEADSIVAW